MAPSRYRYAKAAGRRFRRRRTTLKRKRTIRRRRTYRSSRTSKRYIRNVASDKKQDARLLFQNITTPANPPVLANTVVLNGSTFYACLYCPTAMEANTSAKDVLHNYRSKPKIFARGYAERLNFSLTTGTPWVWRRICFTVKDADLWRENATLAPFYQETSPNGFVRTFTQHNSTGAGNYVSGKLFKGVFGRDWQSSLTAATENTFFDVKYDKTMVIRPQNEAGTYVSVKRWHPMNRTLIYAEDEDGSTELVSARSSTSRYSMGDYFIFDIFAAPEGGEDDDLTISLQGTIYWHE